MKHAHILVAFHQIYWFHGINSSIFCVGTAKRGVRLSTKLLILMAADEHLPAPHWKPVRSAHWPQRRCGDVRVAHCENSPRSSNQWCVSNEQLLFRVEPIILLVHSTEKKRRSSVRQIEKVHHTGIKGPSPRAGGGCRYQGPLRDGNYLPRNHHFLTWSESLCTQPIEGHRIRIQDHSS